MLLEAGGNLSFLWWVCLFFEQQQKPCSTINVFVVTVMVFPDCVMRNLHSCSFALAYISPYFSARNIVENVGILNLDGRGFNVPFPSFRYCVPTDSVTR